MAHNEYVSPFSARYVSREISHLFSQQFKISTFRRLWVALAKAQQKLGLKISQKQIDQMKAHVDKIDFDAVHEYEKKFRHDVMAHIHAFGDQCPDAKPIIHLGATSSYAADNADLIQMKEALHLLHSKLIHILRELSSFAQKFSDAPTVSYTHFQSAQPTTIGKRACLWLQDFYHDALDWERLLNSIPFLGAKGATGTQASFLALFEEDSAKVLKLEELIAHEFGFNKILPIASQTYSRKIDLSILNAFESFAASAHKMATDLRLLAHEGEVQEAFAEKQIGSSAMPYKRNPIYAERICGIARFVISLAQNPAYTAATQWLERSLDDSSNRRLSISEAFLGTDAILNLLAHLIPNLAVDSQLAEFNLKKALPFLAMENILMAGVKKGGNRQDLHEKLRQLSLEARTQPHPYEFLLKKLESDFSLTKSEIKKVLDLKKMVGRSPQQVHGFLKHDIEPYLLKTEVKEPSFPPIEI
ncbi:MAG: adenylosuccinate lyase [Verrucomicrobia bacterium]|nr:adenylosuccinate lyase [Verrucomicrobiota bacterium]